MFTPSLTMPPLNTTLLGVLRGMADYYKMPLSGPILFGCSGHAFLLNIHPELCPSGPYVWNFEDYIRLVRNLGIEIRPHGFYHNGSSSDDRATAEAIIRKMLDDGVPCAMVNMENQIIAGYNETGFDLVQPWNSDCEGMTPNRLTFGSWKELGDEIHLVFTSYHRVNPVDEKEAIRAALNFALDLYENPSRHTSPPYSVGREAFSNWANALSSGKANQNGSWWNAMVWAECRNMAAEFFKEIAGKDSKIFELAMVLSEEYEDIALIFSEVGNREKENSQKAEAIRQASEIEFGCLPRITALIRDI